MQSIYALISQNVGVSWAILGSILVLIEITMLPAIGFLFAGLGAITLGGLVSYGLVSAQTSIFIQISYFFALTIVWTIVLWVPIQRLRKGGGKYNDMIGSTGVVEGVGLERGKTGKVRWSGAVMKARLAENTNMDSLKHGDEVTVIGVKGNMLYVQPASLSMPSDEELQKYKEEFDLK